MPVFPSVLCEFCGYDLTGSGAVGVCGECGRDVAESLAQRRMGSPWQRATGLFSLLAAWPLTLMGVVVRPRRFWSEVTIESRRSLLLLVINAGFGTIAAWMIVAAGWEVGRTVGAVEAAGWMGLAVGFIMVLSGIEYSGLRVFGKRNGWRVTHGVAAAVVGHASVGWLVGLVLGAVGYQAGVSAGGRGIVLPVALQTLAGVSRIGWGVVLGVVGFGVGMMVFEVLVYLGVRRCRFANPPSARL
ncbi:MAG: hypothetical protein ACNA8P_04035 [Phycisphaerales bacterium]